MFLNEDELDRVYRRWADEDGQGFAYVGFLRHVTITLSSSSKHQLEDATSRIVSASIEVKFIAHRLSIVVCHVP